MIDGKILSWWEKLDQEEKDLLITMLYDMNGEDFRQFGVKIDDDGEKYVKI